MKPSIVANPDMPPIQEAGGHLGWYGVEHLEAQCRHPVLLPPDPFALWKCGSAPL